MTLTQSTFNIDIQNRSASLAFYRQTNLPGTLPSVNINVKLDDSIDTKTVAQVKQQASEEAIKLLEEVIAFMRMTPPVA
jgi:hypothetical protein